MNDKQILDRLESINLSLRQKKDLIDIIKDIAGNNNSDDNGSSDNNILRVYANLIEYKILINDIEYEIAEDPEHISYFAIKDETLYNYIKNYFDKYYYAYVTVVVNNDKNIKTYIKAICPLYHIINRDIDIFDIKVIIDGDTLCRIFK